MKVHRIPILDPKKISELELDTLVITSDEQKILYIKLFSQFDKRIPHVIMAGNDHLKFNDSIFEKITNSAFIKSHAFGYENMLIHIYQSLVYISHNDLKGDIAEFGVYKGGTTSFIAKTIHELGINSRIFAFDTFNGFPPKRNILDLYDNPNDEYFDERIVSNFLKNYDIEIVKGDIAQTFESLRNTQLVFSFFDTDNYTPTAASLDLCYRQTVNGGILAFDHFYCEEKWLYTLGEHIAVKDYFKDKKVLNLYGTGIFMKL
jgi:hypothetical protein